MAKFLEIFEDVTKFGTKIPTNKYQKDGKYPIIDQGQSEISGYTDKNDGVFKDVPAIIFGDHTRVIKYIDTPCFLGADGTKLLKAKISNVNYKYLYYALCNAKIPDTGYNRHFKWLKELEFDIPSISRQEEFVNILQKIDLMIVEHKQQLIKFDELIKSRNVGQFDEARMAVA